MSEIRLVNTALNNYFINNKIEIKDSIPTEGNYNVGDIVIKSTQLEHMSIGWICIEAGNPGVWSEFGGMFEEEEKPIELEPGSVGLEELNNEVKAKLMLIEAINTNVQSIQDITEIHDNEITQLQSDVSNINQQIEDGIGDVTSETIGELNNLNTEDKSNIVAAINELNNHVLNVNTELNNRILNIDTELNTLREEIGGVRINLINSCNDLLDL